MSLAVMAYNIKRMFNILGEYSSKLVSVSSNPSLPHRNT